MGLDMYLTKEYYIASKYEHREVKAVVDVSVNGVKLDIDVSKLDRITTEVMCWRKANQIHGWFVKNIQDNNDDCERYEVTQEQLLILRDVCLKALETKDPSLLPPMEGFFFGSNEITQWYWQDLRETVDALENLETDTFEITYYYRSSW